MEDKTSEYLNPNYSEREMMDQEVYCHECNHVMIHIRDNYFRCENTDCLIQGMYVQNTVDRDE